MVADGNGLNPLLKNYRAVMLANADGELKAIAGPDNFDVIAFDADDTLWHNEVLFTDTQDRFRKLLDGDAMGPPHDQVWRLDL